MADTRRQQSWTERAAADAAPTDDIDRAMKRQGFHNSHTSLGTHWIGLAGTLAPIVIGEIITDPAKRWRATRLAAVGIAVASQGLYTVQELRRRKQQEAKLAECQSRGG
jgi:hypothetical protein